MEGDGATESSWGGLQLSLHFGGDSPMAPSCIYSATTKYNSMVEGKPFRQQIHLVPGRGQTCDVSCSIRGTSHDPHPIFGWNASHVHQAHPCSDTSRPRRVHILRYNCYCTSCGYPRRSTCATAVTGALCPVMVPIFSSLSASQAMISQSKPADRRVPRRYERA